MALETAYINENNEKISPKKDTLILTSSSPVGSKKSVDNAAYMTGRAETKQCSAGEEYNKY